MWRLYLNNFIVVNWLIHSFTHSSILSFIHQLFNSFTHSFFVHVFILQLVIRLYTSIHSHTYLPFRSFIHSFNHLLNRSFIHPFCHSFHQSIKHVYVYVWFIQLSWWLNILMLTDAKSSMMIWVKYFSREHIMLKYFKQKYQSEHYQRLSFKYFVNSYLILKLLSKVS